MKDRQNAVLDALQRAQRFLEENAALLTGVDLTAARQRLDLVATSFTTHALDQDVGTRGAKGEPQSSVSSARSCAGTQMEPIALIARRNLHTVPEFHALQMPKPSVRGQGRETAASFLFPLL